MSKQQITVSAPLTLSLKDTRCKFKAIELMSAPFSSENCLWWKIDACRWRSSGTIPVLSMVPIKDSGKLVAIMEYGQDSIVIELNQIFTEVSSTYGRVPSFFQFIGLDQRIEKKHAEGILKLGIDSPELLRYVTREFVLLPDKEYFITCELKKEAFTLDSGLTAKWKKMFNANSPEFYYKSIGFPLLTNEPNLRTLKFTDRFKSILECRRREREKTKLWKRFFLNPIALIYLLFMAYLIYKSFVNNYNAN